jgi:hypothetical protein
MCNIVPRGTTGSFGVQDTPSITKSGNIVVGAGVGSDGAGVGSDGAGVGDGLPLQLLPNIANIIAITPTRPHNRACIPHLLISEPLSGSTIRPFGALAGLHASSAIWLIRMNSVPLNNTNHS